MEDVKNEVKIIIVENNLKGINQGIYDKVIACRVGKKAGDKEMVDAATEALTKLEKMKDEYNKILKELKTESKKK